MTAIAKLKPILSRFAWAVLALALASCREPDSGVTAEPGTEPSTAPDASAASAPRNVVFILSDDHRYDFMGFMSSAPDWLQTPALDRMAAGGAHLRNAFVTTALCSPSRASILTGQYAHRQRIVDNTSPIPEGTRCFPEFLQQVGYRTAYVGKWHMGEVDDMPQPGFDHWVSFRGQGVYEDPVLNVNGERVEAKGYTTDLLTDRALDWLQRQQAEEPDKPFFLYLSHKAVHAEFVPAPRHRGRYADEPIPSPETMDESANRDKPDWVRAQRNSWHGVDYMYHGDMAFDGFYKAYAETLLALDESVGRVLDYLKEAGLEDDTLVIYMGDNGFLLGEHGLIDKRNAYEESMRVPMLAYAPGWIEAGSTIELTPFINHRNLIDAEGIDEVSSNYAEAVRLGHLVRDAKGEVASSEWWKGEGGLVDFTDPAAVAWWHAQLRKTKDYGAHCSPGPATTRAASASPTDCPRW